jgi:glutamate dehydrogenase/leucine dehydrogenase
MDLLESHPQEFVRFLRNQNINRFYFVSDDAGRRVRPSHPVLQPVADFLTEDRRDYDNHEGLFFQISTEFETLQGAFVHRTVRGAGAGGVRFWQYDTLEDYLRDGLRLSKGMTHKNALAGLWWGGGKGVMAHKPEINKSDPAVRETLYRDYGRLMTSIRGCYVTAEDAGTNVTDMANVFATTRFTTCIPPELGGSGNPSVPTARGIVCGMEAALEFAGMGSLADKVIAVQGTGNVGGPLIGYLFEDGVKHIIATDINDASIAGVKAQNPGKDLEVRAVKIGDNSILSEKCDIVSPCATGAILNPQTIPHIRARIVCGAANNQLEDALRDDRALFKSGIIYVPDFLTNRMGIVNCANEQYGYVKNDRYFERHLSRDWEHSIYQTALRVLRRSKQSSQPPAAVAIKLAEELSMQPHPIFGHRGKEIIRSLLEDKWHESRS